MPKIKLNTFEGIFTDIDQNDLKLELFQDSINFRHEYGYAKFEPRNLSEYSLPNVDNYMGDAPGTWTWENGIFCTLTNDILADDPVSAKYEVLVVVAKKIDGIYTDRLVWLQEYPDGVWYEMSQHGNYNNIDILNHDGLGDFTGSFFRTTKSGEVFFKVNKGILKIYFPHACFWVGRLARKFHINTELDEVTDQYYIDKLIEWVDGTAEFDVNDNLQNYRCPVKFDTSLVDATGLSTIGDRLGHFEYLKYIVDIDRTGYYRDVYHVFYGFRDNLTNQLIFTLEGFTTDDLDLASNDPLAVGYPITIEFNISDLNSFDITPDGFVYSAPEITANIWSSATQATINTYNFNYNSFKLIGDNTDLFKNADGKLLLIGTVTLDEKEEIIAYRYDAGTPNDNEVLKVDITIPPNVNKRITRIKLYIKQPALDIDYSLVKELHLLSEDTDALNLKTIYLIKTDKTGVLLSQNIGYLVDENKPSDYKVLTGFRDIITDSDITIGITTDDYSNVYHSVVGGGVLQSDLLYRANILPLPGTSVVNAVANLNSKIVIFAEHTSYVLIPSESVGQLVFSIVDTLEYGVKNNKDVSTSGAEIFINTKNGIFATDGYNTKPVSKNINNICKSNFDTSTIQYNPVLHELYYRPTTSEDTYRFRFDRGVWEKLNLTYENPGGIALLTDANYILVDFDGYKAYLQDSKIWTYDAADASAISAELLTNNSDLGEPSLDKIINYYDLDYKGSGTITFYADGTAISTESLDYSATRILKRFYVLLDNRKPALKVQWKITSSLNTTEIYGLEVDFTVLKKRVMATESVEGK